MKKFMLHSLFAVVAATSLSAQAEFMPESQLRDLVGSNYANTATFFRGDSWWLPVKYFALSAAPGAGFGYVFAEDRSARLDWAIVMGLVTGVSGTIMVYTDRFVRVHKMNNFLKEYSPTSSIKELSDAEAVMLCGAHYKDLGVMRRLLPHLSGFLHEMGTWEVLTELYFDEPDSTVVNSGSSVRPGYSQGGGFHIDTVHHNSVSQVKHAYMTPEVMKRRIKVLKAKLGYTE